MNIIQEHITHPHQSFRVLRLELGSFRAPRHRHHHVELTWIEDSAGLRIVGDSVQPFAPGDLVLLGPNLPHAWISARHKGRRRHVATVLQFAPEVLDATHLPELASTRALLESASRGLQVEEPARSAVTEALTRMRNSTGLSGLATLIEVLALLVQHRSDLVPLASKVMGAANSSKPEQDRRIARVIDWVHRHYARALTVEAAARLVHISPAAFSRFFSREVGKTFTQYINDVRCSEACIRLRSSDKPVALIAQECGFDTMSHFNRQFRARTGASPLAYRREP
jgi:AraC-like DNA-binding protein